MSEPALFEFNNSINTGNQSNHNTETNDSNREFNFNKWRYPHNRIK